MGYLQQLNAWQPVLRAFERKHGKLASGIAASLDEDARRSVIRSLRGSITEPEHRFFLALLMNAPTHKDLLALVAQRFPKQQPADVVVRWIEELAEATEDGVAILDATFPSSLDMEPAAQFELMVAAFQQFTKGGKNLAPPLRRLSPGQFKALRTAFLQSVFRVLAI
jgi:hypothetical protein